MTELQVGSPLTTYEDFDRLPIGSVIGPPGHVETYEKRTDGWWCEEYHSLAGVGEFSLGGYNHVIKIGKGKTTLESLRQWQWRYRDNAYSSASAAGVSLATVHDAMRELGIGDDVFPLGRGVQVANQYDLNRLSEGALVQRGDPADVNRFGLFVKNRSGWVHLLGEQGSLGSDRVTVVNGDPVEWPVIPGTVEEQDDLLLFKARAWRYGWKVKLQHRWCETYESYMSRIGLTSDVLNHVPNGGASVGERINPLLAAQLPEGSVLRWVRRSDARDYTWFIRDNSMSNEGRTRALFGHRSDGSNLRNYASVMEVLYIHDPDGVMDLRPDNWDAIIEHIPVGTMLRYGDSELVVAPDHRLGYPNEDRGRWRPRELGYEIRIVRFP